MDSEAKPVSRLSTYVQMMVGGKKTDRQAGSSQSGRQADSGRRVTCCVI